MFNLCFHGIGTPRRDLEDGEDRYWITPEVYRGVLDVVAERDDVRLSFDDANASDHEFGLPALVERGLRADFFVLSGRLDTPGSLSSEQVRDLVAHGMTIGSHGMHHVPWRGLDPVARRSELVEARDAIAAVAGTPVRTAALPLGRYDRALVGHLKAAGYDTVFTSDRRPARAGSWLQPRFSLRREDTVAGVRDVVLVPPPLVQRAKLTAVGLAKRVR